MVLREGQFDVKETTVIKKFSFSSETLAIKLFVWVPSKLVTLTKYWNFHLSESGMH